jgi:hypothetical protein
MSNLPVRRIRGMKSTNTRSKRAFITKIYEAMLPSVGKDLEPKPPKLLPGAEDSVSVPSMLGRLSGGDNLQKFLSSPPAFI